MQLSSIFCQKGDKASYCIGVRQIIDIDISQEKPVLNGNVYFSTPVPAVNSIADAELLLATPIRCPQLVFIGILLDVQEGKSTDNVRMEEKVQMHLAIAFKTECEVYSSRWSDRLCDVCLSWRYSPGQVWSTFALMRSVHN